MYSKLEFEKINKLLGDKTFIFELEPSNANKKACLDYKNNLLEIAYKNASKQSIAELICKRIKILHGVGMFMPINQYAKAPSEINYMQKHEFSRLVPMIPYINPVIFSIGLTNFKIETLMQ